MKNKLILEKRDAEGNVIDTIALTESTWKNLPDAKKVEWKIKEPEELKTKKNESKQSI